MKSLKNEAGKIILGKKEMIEQLNRYPALVFAAEEAMSIQVIAKNAMGAVNYRYYHSTK